MYPPQVGASQLPLKAVTIGARRVWRQFPPRFHQQKGSNGGFRIRMKADRFLKSGRFADERQRSALILDATLSIMSQSVTLAAPSLQNISDHSFEIWSRQQMQAFLGPLQAQAGRPLNDGLPNTHRSVSR